MQRVACSIKEATLYNVLNNNMLKKTLLEWFCTKYFCKTLKIHKFMQDINYLFQTQINVEKKAG